MHIDPIELSVETEPKLNGAFATLGRLGFAQGRIHRTLDDGWSSNLARLAELLGEH